MERFNLDTWLQDKSRKVVTRDRRHVRIVCTDSPDAEYRITGFINESVGVFMWKSNGDYSSCGENDKDLFFADEEEELTEFEKEIKNWMSEFLLCTDQPIPNKTVKQAAKKVLDLARKEIEEGAVEFAKSYMEDANPSFEKVQESEELWKWKMSCLRGVNKAYTQGKQDALKDLPKWKAYKGKLIGNGLIFEDNANLVLVRNGYYIDINKLEKLSKEE